MAFVANWFCMCHFMNSLTNFLVLHDIITTGKNTIMANENYKGTEMITETVCNWRRKNIKKDRRNVRGKAYGKARIQGCLCFGHTFPTLLLKGKEHGISFGSTLTLNNLGWFIFKDKLTEFGISWNINRLWMDIYS